MIERSKGHHDWPVRRTIEGGPVWNGVYYASELLPGGISAGRYTPGSTKSRNWKYIGELLNSRFLPETRTEILNIAQRMRSEDGMKR